MGGLQWWFFDGLAAAIIIACMAVSGRRGFMKSAMTFAAYILAFAMAFSISTSMGSGLSNGTVKNNNAKKISNELSSLKFTLRVAEEINSMGYGVTVKVSELDEIYSSNKDYNTEIFKYINIINGRKVETDKERFSQRLHEGYVNIMREVLTGSVKKFPMEAALKDIRENPQKFDDFIPLLLSSDNCDEAAKYIANRYTKKSYTTIISLIAYVIIFVIFFIIFYAFANALIGKGFHNITIPSHVGGALVGIPKGLIMCYSAAIVIRLCAVMGSNADLYFGFKAIDKTYIFKYLYKYIANNV